MKTLTTPTQRTEQPNSSAKTTDMSRIFFFSLYFKIVPVWAWCGGRYLLLTLLLVWTTLILNVCFSWFSNITDTQPTSITWRVTDGHTNNLCATYNTVLVTFRNIVICVALSLSHCFVTGVHCLSVISWFATVSFICLCLHRLQGPELSWAP